MKKPLLKLIGLLIITVSLLSLNLEVKSHPFTRYENLKTTTVYVTKTGAKYHRETCSYLRQSKIATTKKEAVSNGYGACSRCKP